MDGYGDVAVLPEHLKSIPNVMMFHGNGVFDNKPNGGKGIWAPLKAGHGGGFASDGVKNYYSKRFGAELSFAYALTKQFPDKHIAIIKYAVGGTGLHLKTGYGNWSPDFREGNGQNQYDFALTTFANAFAAQDIDGDGEKDTLVPAGIMWMQGEADAHQSEASAKAYEYNLTRLMNLLRAALRDDSVTVVIAKITDSQLGEEDIMPFIDIVHQAQKQFVSKDICAAYMEETSTYPYEEKDPWHYLSPGYISMGEDFARHYIKLAKTCAK
ncbi:sialate O-acetylesterase [Thalassotalea agarivorans]|uniref:Sialate O-acetylesterase domain-containing protein n=1 Tax=Thalassotalea agarivorans TaxID=349064 RepID=A0A1I0AGP5_THASX|nr:sialate O-acetylesterase [Thalassotalea agarivorans]SES92872.1 hypothetical protein SAMN05660429_00685 [Thalassotalea agarivorans]